MPIEGSYVDAFFSFGAPVPLVPTNLLLDSGFIDLTVFQMYFGQHLRVLTGITRSVISCMVS